MHSLVSTDILSLWDLRFSMHSFTNITSRWDLLLPALPLATDILSHRDCFFYPHLDEPQSLHVRQPSWYSKFVELQFWHFCFFASVPSGIYCFNARATPFFHVLMDSSSCRLLIRSTTFSIGIPWRNVLEISFA